jgi:hypothetical protein
MQVLTAVRRAAATALCSALTRNLHSMPLTWRCILTQAHVAYMQQQQSVHEHSTQLAN